MFDYRIEKLNCLDVDFFCTKLKADFPYLFKSVEFNQYVKKISDKSTFVTCRDSRNQLLGIISFYMNNFEYTYISLVGILKMFQKQGIFSRMLYMLEAKCLCQNYNQIRLEVSPQNKIAQVAYAKRGFAILDTQGNSMHMIKHVAENFSI